MDVVNSLTQNLIYWVQGIFLNKPVGRKRRAAQYLKFSFIEYFLRHEVTEKNNVKVGAICKRIPRSYLKFGF